MDRWMEHPRSDSEDWMALDGFGWLMLCKHPPSDSKGWMAYQVAYKQVQPKSYTHCIWHMIVCDI